MSSGFISEAEAVEIRKRRQEEWDRVRKPTDPVEKPEEPYDGRSLFEKLQEQKQKKELEYEEAHKLKNMIKGLDDDEVEFLDLVDRTKLAADKIKEIEEERELKDFRNRVAILQEKSIEDRLLADVVVKPKNNCSSNLNQQKLLKGVVVKKKPAEKRKMSSEDEANKGDKAGHEPKKSKDINSYDQGDNVRQENNSNNSSGLGNYDDSSSNSSDSDTSVEESKLVTDLLGRKIVKVEDQSQATKSSQ